MDDDSKKENIPVGEKASQEVESSVDQPGFSKTGISPHERQFTGQSEKNAEKKMDQKSVLDAKPKISEDFFQERSAADMDNEATPYEDQDEENTKEKPDMEQKPVFKEKPKKKASSAEVAGNKAVPPGGRPIMNPMQSGELQPPHDENAEGNQPPHDQNAILEEIEVIRQDIGNLRQEFHNEVGELQNGMNQIMALLMEQNQQRQQSRQPSSDIGQSNRDRQ